MSSWNNSIFSIKFSGSTNRDDHVFCFINWKKHSPQYDWFGKSAMVSSVLNETNDVCCYMPIPYFMIAHMTHKNDKQVTITFLICVLEILLKFYLLSNFLLLFGPPKILNVFNTRC